MSESFHITLVQADLAWEQPEQNRSMLDELLATTTGSDLILLPEMFTTGFSMQAARLAEPTDGPTLAWMRHLAARKDALVCGSFIATEGGRYYNRMLGVQPDGSYTAYDKRHLFRMAGEQEVYEAGDQRPILHWRGWRILPLVCYDLRFPVWSRNHIDHTELAYDLALYVANWPERRSAHWQKLLAARAIENQAYVAGVNRVGKDGLDHVYAGHSALYDYQGEVLCGLSPHQVGVATCTLSLNSLRQYRDRFPAWMDQDTFSLH
ncbi:MAG: amidohydrolase [Sphingobacteriia bacterium]|jgi:omega-amidase